MAETREATEAIPTKGNCYTTYGGAFACKWIELHGEEPDGCCCPMPEAETFTDEGDMERNCPAFACDPTLMLRRAYDFIERLKERTAGYHALEAAARRALQNDAPDQEQAVRNALDKIDRTYGRAPGPR